MKVNVSTIIAIFRINIFFPITQIAENQDISFLHSHVYSLSCDLNNLKSEVNMASIPQKEKGT